MLRHRNLHRPGQSIREGVFVALGFLTLIVIMVAGVSLGVRWGWFR